jgi:CRISPR-associated protein Csb2
MLAIEVELLTGRYVATAYNTRLEGEWPPHPARLFSALAATHFTSDEPDPKERAILEWLERQEAPAIRASEASHREVTTVFVPVNDAAMTNVDKEAEALEAARTELEETVSSGQAKAIKQASSAAEKAQKRLGEAIARSVSIPKTAINPSAGMHVLPEHRVRQPRTFPSVTPVERRVTYVWPSASPTSLQREVIDHLLERLVRLGHSSSLVAARLVDETVDVMWRPSKGGEVILRTVQVGQLAALERAYALHRETEPRLMPARFESYTRLAPTEQTQIPHSSFSDEWLVLRRVGGPLLPMVATAGIARALRKALMSHAPGAVAEVLSGHTPDGGPSERDHLAIVPLPFVGHQQASGAVLGVALILPRNATQDGRPGVFAAIDAWERAERLEDEDTPRLAVTMGAAGVLELERVEWGVAQASLRAASWCRPARIWHSVTPVALDHNPGDLRSRDAKKLATAIGEARGIIARACGRIGLPDPLDVEVLPAAPVAGASKVQLYPPFPEESGRTRRVLTHVRLEFAELVRGPILLGAGRYLGLGLFRPEAVHG